MRFFLLLILAGCSSNISTEEVFGVPPGLDTWIGPNGEKKGYIGEGRLDTVYYKNQRDGQKWKEGYILANGDRHGIWTYWHKNGEKQQVRRYRNGWEVGYSDKWYANGQKEWEGVYTYDGQPVRWTWWNADGSVNQEKSGMYIVSYKEDDEGSSIQAKKAK